MNDDEIITRRLHGLALRGDIEGGLEDVVGRLAALQAQELPIAKWSIAQRRDGVTEAAVDRALADGALLRTHVLRPTWHIVPARDIRWMLDLTAPRILRRSAAQYEHLELDDELLTRSTDLIARALEGGKTLTRKELAAVLQGAGTDPRGPRLAMMLMRAELDAVICSGSQRGRQQTYALLDERAPGAVRKEPDEALAELTMRYFSTRGPATMKDFMWWSSLTAAEARRGLGLVGDRLDQRVVEDRTYWFTGPRPPASERSSVIDLLQVYDEYVMSYRESRDVIGARPGELDHSILRNGRLVGRWKPVEEKGSVVVEVIVRGRFTRNDERALAAAVDRFGRFKGSGRVTIIRR